MENNVVDISSKRTKPVEEDEKRWFLTLKGMIGASLSEELKNLSYKEIEAMSDRIFEKIKNYATRVSESDNEGGFPAVVFHPEEKGGIFVTIHGEPRN